MEQTNLERHLLSLYKNLGFLCSLITEFREESQKQERCLEHIEAQLKEFSLQAEALYKDIRSEKA